MIQFKCPHCEKAFRVDDSYAGKGAKCAGCGQRITIPRASGPPALPTVKPPVKAPSVAAVSSRPQVSAAVPTHRQDTVACRFCGEQILAGAEKCRHCGEILDAAMRAAIVATPQAVPTTAVQLAPQMTVNVAAPSRSSHSLGVASLVVGVLSFFVCWMPVIGLLLGGLGLVLGIGGLVIAITRKGGGIGYSIAGSAVSALSVMIGISFAAAISSMFAGINKATHQTGTISPEAQPVSKANANSPIVTTTPVAPDNKDTTTPASKAAPGAMAATPASEKSPPSHAKDWIDANKYGGMLGDIGVTVVSAKTGVVQLHRNVMNDDSESKDSLFTIWLTIQNKSERKKLNYRSWADDSLSFLDNRVTLKDDAGNTYRGVSFGFSTTVKGAAGNESVYPGKEIRDALVFELPIDKIEYLELVLPGKYIGEEGELRFKIPKAMIKN